MPSVKITRKVLGDLVPEHRTYVRYDSELPGFGVRVTPAGTMSWIVEYRPNGGGRRSNTRRMTLGSVKKLKPEQAREQAEKVVARATLGGDPAFDRQEQRAAATLADLAQLFMDEFVRPKKKPRTAQLYDAYFRLHVNPTLGTRKARDVTLSDIARLHRKIGVKKQITANRVLAVLSTLYSWAARAGEVEKSFNPARGVEKFKEEGKERYLSTDELARLGDALREAETTGIPWDPDGAKPTSKHAPKPENRFTPKMDASAVAAIRLLLLTGCRLREVLHLRWKDVDIERGVLFLPDSKTGRKEVILSESALSIVKGLDRLGPYVVPGQDPKKPRHDLHRPWATVSRRAGLVGVRLHDLRHTFASFGAGSGLGLPILGKLLGHKNASTTARYAHLDSDPLRKASDRIGGTISAALNGRAGAV